jgi:hypothetical protein
LSASAFFQEIGPPEKNQHSPRITVTFECRTSNYDRRFGDMFRAKIAGIPDTDQLPSTKPRIIQGNWNIPVVR